MKHAVDRAIELNPNSPDAHAALAEYYYRGFYDYEKSLEHLELAYELMPNNSEVLYNMGLTLRRLGRWTESVDRFEEAGALDPADIRTFQEVMNTASDSRDPRGRYWSEELGRRFPESAPIAGVRAIYYLQVDGDLAAAREALAMARPEDDYYYVRASFEIPLWERDYETAVEQILKRRDAWDVLTPGTVDTWVGWFLTLAGETERAEGYLALAMDQLLAELQKPYAETYAWPHVVVAIAYALQGDRDNAITSCDRAQTILPESRDKVHGVNIAALCAQAKGLVGETEFVVSEIERLGLLPNEIMTVNVLRLDPRWDYIRDHPRVQALLAKHSE
jgi:serine/threonine-protein kinase